MVLHTFHCVDDVANIILKSVGGKNYDTQRYFLSLESNNITIRHGKVGSYLQNDRNKKANPSKSEKAALFM